MGLLNKLFGGGTQLELKLDLDKIPSGGTVAGTLTLTGGKKPLKLTALKVDVVSVLVESKDGSALPSVDVRVLTSNIVAQDRDLAPGSHNKFEFRYKLPDDLNPEATYKVMATADIPGVKDPSAEAPLTVLGARSTFGAIKSALGMGASEDDVLGQFPDLTSHDSDEVEAALHELQCEAYDRDNNFTGVHGFLLRLVETHREGDVRRAALATGAAVTTLDATEHDEAVAAVSHLPQLAASLVAARLEHLPASAVALAGQGLRDVTRIAASDPGLWTQILSGNAAAVKALLMEVAADLQQVIGALDDLAADRTSALPGDAPGARGVLAAVVAAGNAGHARIPGKHGAAPTAYETVRVLIPDEPGQLGRLFADVGDLGINIEEFKLDHGLGQSFGLAEVDVVPAVSAALAEGLSQRGWRIHG